MTIFHDDSCWRALFGCRPFSAELLHSSVTSLTAVQC